MGKTLCIDPGDMRIGIAISDIQSKLARPVMILRHVSRNEDAKRIMRIAEENEVDTIVIGQSIDEHGEPTLQGRKAARLAEMLTSDPRYMVVLWDEYQSTVRALELKIRLGASSNNRGKHVDDQAAAVILQEYLDNQDDKTVR